MSRNYLLNPDFSVTQRGTSFTSTTSPANSDDTFLLDRWILLSDGNDIVDVTQQTSSTHLPANCISGISLDVETANKKFGILQVLEQREAGKGLHHQLCEAHHHIPGRGQEIARSQARQRRGRPHGQKTRRAQQR